jgi:hypothetical protein
MNLSVSVTRNLPKKTGQVCFQSGIRTTGRSVERQTILPVRSLLAKWDQSIHLNRYEGDHASSLMVYQFNGVLESFQPHQSIIINDASRQLVLKNQLDPNANSV